MNKEKFMELRRQQPTHMKDGKWVYEGEVSTVRVMARAEGYAMVRHKGCVPFVVSEKDLHPMQGEKK